MEIPLHQLEATGAGALTRFLARWPRRSVLRAGFGIVIGLLVFSSLNAYLIQQTLSRQTLEAYRRHVRQDDALLKLRRSVWLGGSACRDYLLNPFPDRETTYRAQLVQLAVEIARQQRELESSRAPDAGGAHGRRLREAVSSYWRFLETVPEATRGLDPPARYRFVQNEVAPRRTATGEVITEYTETAQAALQENEATFARQRRDSVRRLLLLLGVSTVAALLVAGISLHHTGQLEGRAAAQLGEVVQAKAELQQLSARLMKVQEEERTRLSRELHDEIGQTLATLKLEIHRAESVPELTSATVRERLRRARELAERTLQTVRDTSRLLRPALLDDLGLGPALEWLAGEFTQRTGIACRFIEEGPGGQLSDAVRTCVFRVAQEALHNAEKHAAATRVEVRLRVAAGELGLEIEDDGRGLRPAREAPPLVLRHFGILGMRERAAALGGVLEVSSGPGAGARVHLRLPLGAPAPAPAGESS